MKLNIRSHFGSSDIQRRVSSDFTFALWTMGKSRNSALKAVTADLASEAAETSGKKSTSGREGKTASNPKTESGGKGRGRGRGRGKGIKSMTAAAWP